MTARIFYASGTVFDGVPQDAPPYGVLAILHHGVIEHGMDWYVHRCGRWNGVKGDASLILQFMHHAAEIEACLAGETVPNEVFQAVMRRAVEEQAHDQSSHRTG